MRSNDDILSVGIDIGTSTTKLVFSKLRIANTAGYTRVPRFEIVDREVTYRSRMHRTFLKSERVIDMEKTWELILSEYRDAGFSLHDIHTGAIIITGETATKENARDVVSTLAHRSGDFVVATAGPDLEAILAGKGSGAFQLSKQSGDTIANVDIGGGTANISVFRRGVLLGTCTLHIGGRMLCFQDGQIARLSGPLREWCKSAAVNLYEGLDVMRHEEEIRTFAFGMARVLANTLQRRMGQEENILLLGRPPNWSVDPDIVMISGGVGGMLQNLAGSLQDTKPISFSELLLNRASANDGFADSGVVLAHALLTSKEMTLFRRAEPVETMRATVIGAGAQSVELSGATIFTNTDCLPLQNIPVVTCSLSEPDAAWQELRTALVQAKAIYDPEAEGQTYAFLLQGISTWGFSDLKQLAAAFARVLYTEQMSELTAVVITEGDIGKALGQCLTSEGIEKLVCIDQITVEHGDYVDIGLPFGHLEAVPVMIKTLVLDVPKGVAGH